VSPLRILVRQPSGDRRRSDVDSSRFGSRPQAIPCRAQYNAVARPWVSFSSVYRGASFWRRHRPYTPEARHTDWSSVNRHSAPARLQPLLRRGADPPNSFDAALICTAAGQIPFRTATHAMAAGILLTTSDRSAKERRDSCTMRRLLHIRRTLDMPNGRPLARGRRADSISRLKPHPFTHRHWTRRAVIGCESRRRVRIARRWLPGSASS